MTRLLLATALALLAGCADCHLAHGHLACPGSPMPSDHLAAHCVPSQCCCCTAAILTLSTWSDPSRDADDRLQNATTRATIALLVLQPHRLWAHWAIQHWWLHIVQHTWDNEQCLEVFRITRATFRDLMEQHRPHLEWQDIGMWTPLPADIQMALALLKLAMPASL
ncbi:hypothetical protein Y1Q_0007318 [Alligator mississippiensis]|uniref:Uncharacterized protein n=1 Tax=Alligator mississippiensis TaxID=8496 RepID=A0A151P7K7_ALLMI|nr:hypothetical protein Y1Q_0007318 [Alligator mississippiensis]